MQSTGVITEQVLRQVSADAAVDSGGMDQDLLGEFLPALVAAVAAGARPARGQIRRCRAMGEQAARAGVALPAVLNLYLSAAWRLWRHLPAVQQAGADPQAVVGAGEVMLRADGRRGRGTGRGISARAPQPGSRTGVGPAGVHRRPALRPRRRCGPAWNVLTASDWISAGRMRSRSCTPSSRSSTGPR